VTNLPFISIVVPVYNSISTLSLCLESIQKLNYPKDKLEVIIVDNGSDDGCDNVARKLDFRVLYERSVKSSYSARNIGILEAKGELIAFTDSDCIVTSDWLKNLVREWNDPSIGCFAGEILAYNPETLVERFSDRIGVLRQKGTLNCPYLPYTQTANSAYRKEVFDIVGLFNPEIVSGGDADLSWRMQRETDLKIKFVPDAVVYHKHRDSIIGLYRQFKKYERGKLLWLKYYPDYEMPTLEQRKSELIRDIKTLFEVFPSSLRKFLNNQIDTVALFSPLFRVIMSLGTYRGRMSQIENKQVCK
jgi:cellulose synthase/poly-beta-1,6-N-acetylglucosamine synthase-like glycosyltransferase